MNAKLSAFDIDDSSKEKFKKTVAMYLMRWSK